MSRFGTKVFKDGWVARYGSVVLLLAALLLFGLSYIRPDYEARLSRQLRQVESSLHKRERLAERYAYLALQGGEEEWVDFEDMPEDIVLYLYRGDTMKSWTHEFPISNDALDFYSRDYRLQYMSDRTLQSTPLAYIGIQEKYVNLGSAWYVVTTHFTEDRMLKVVTGVLIKTEYTSSAIPNTVNKHIRLHDDYTTVPIHIDDTAIVYGIEDEPLFSIVPTETPTPGHGNMLLRWISFALLILAVMSWHFRRHSWKSFNITILTLVALRLLAWWFVSQGYATGELFSPVLYADTTLFTSLGGLLFNNLTVALAFYALFVMRYQIHRKAESLRPAGRHFLIAGLVAATLALMAYIHFVMRSLILNSGITLEPYRLTELGIYAVLCYLSFAMLFLALLYQFHMVVMVVRRDARLSLFSWRPLLIYIFIVSLYSVMAMSHFGLDKEYESNRVNTSKLAIERDLALEMFLREVEPAIQSDPFLAVLSSVGGGELIRNRLLERYLYSDVVRKYNIILSTCTPNNLIELGQGNEPVRCFSFYENMIKEYGVALASGSNFYYLHNYNGLASYLGVFTYFDPSSRSVSRLFLELESKYKNDVIVNPFDALTAQVNTAPTLSRHYSYARYCDDRLVSHGGSYDYPVLPPDDGTPGYRMTSGNGYVHFVNRLSNEDLTIISRSRQPFFPHLVSFSYLALFYGLFFIGVTHRWRKDKLFNLPKHSLKRKITMLITLSLVVAIGTMGVGSIVYVMRLNRENNREAMDGLMTSAQALLADPCKYAMRYNDIGTAEVFHAMDEFNRVTRSDMNLYSTNGELIRSTRPELYDMCLAGKRMSGRAYRQIRIEGQLRYTQVEEIAGIRYHAVYEPVFNGDGQMVAIVEIPYFSRNEDVSDATASTITVIINLYLILLLAAVAMGAFLSNSVSRPLVEIKDRIGSLALSGNRRIRYRNTRDELGVLINAYNKMVEDLEESTRQLAQSEREQAWKEMARQIAHEIKNPLTPMKLSIQYLMRLKEENVPGWEEKLESVSHSLLEQIDTLSQTATEFSSFARFFSEEITRIDLAALIEEQRVLFEGREDIGFEYRALVDGEAPVDARRSQLARVLVNLLTNSIQAIDNSETSGGRVRITLSPTRKDDAGFWQIDVEDNGPGVDEEDLPKLFTPNFTTKKTGTGLGLAICRSIIEQSQGTIDYSRSEMGGARFTITLPKA